MTLRGYGILKVIVKTELWKYLDGKDGGVAILIIAELVKW